MAILQAFSYQELRQISSVSTGDICLLNCRSAINDGCGGMFAYDANDLNSQDNDGTIIVSGSYRFKRIFDGMLNVKWFGAKGDGIHDDINSFNSAILSLKNGGSLYVPEGVYFISDTIVLNKNIRLVGALSPSVVSPCRIKIAKGKTAIRCVPYIPSQIESIAIGAEGKLTTSSIVQNYFPNSNNITVSSGHDFILGQVVSMPAGPLKKMEPLRASTVSGSNIIDISNINITSALGLTLGQYIKINEAFNTPTKIIAINGSSLTVENNSLATKIYVSIYVVTDALFLITSVNGNTLYVDNVNPQGLSVQGVSLKHCDCGIYSNSTINIRDMSFGGPGLGLSGYGIAIVASHNFNPPSNANIFKIDTIFTDSCYGSIYTMGADSNSGTIIAARAFNCSGLAFQELSDLGNHYTGCYASGGLGFISADGGINRSTFVGCYIEGGTSAFFGGTTRVDGGTMPMIGENGFLVDSNIMNRWSVGGLDSWNNGRTYSDPVRAMLGFDMNSSSGLHIKKSTFSNQIYSSLGWLCFDQISTFIGISGKLYSCPIAINVSDSSGAGSLSRKPGTLFFSNGFELGSRENEIPDKPRHRCSTSIEESTGVITDKFARNGDIVWKKNPTSGGNVGWVCVSPGNGLSVNGIFKTFGLIDN